jgi:hypothetical protein
VDEMAFTVDPNGEAAKYGFELYQRIKREKGCRKTELLKVVYNGQNEITELVKNVEKQYLTLD